MNSPSNPFFITMIDEKYLQYTEDVLEGRTVAGEAIKLACQRFLSYLDRDDVVFDHEKADRVVNFCEKLTMDTGKFAGQKFRLTDWQKFVIYYVYGLVWKDSGLRITREVYLQLARKSGKTALASALALYHLAADGEGDAQGVFAANSAEQAQLAFRQATNYMSHLDPKKKYFQTYRSEIRFPLAKSSMKVVSADARRLDGLNLSFFVLDEYHAAQNSDVYNVLASSQGMRNQPMALIITTAGFDLTGPCFQLYQHCKEILHGKVEDDSTAAFIFELDDDDDYTDERVWVKAQPNLDITVTKDYIKKELTKCQISPTAQTNFLTKILNRWCQGEFGDWINADYVLKCLDPVDLKEYEGANCEVGLDLASVSDMAALTVLLDRGTHLVTKNYYFLPQTALKESSNAEKYHNWSRSKKLLLTVGNVIDYDFILNKLQEIHRITPINTIWYDAWNSTALIIRLTELGFNCKPYSQSAGSINKPARELEKRVRECSILMDSNPITTWMFHNVTIKEDYNGNIKPVKVNANSENKIDGVVSILMAIGGWLSIPKFDYGI